MSNPTAPKVGKVSLIASIVGLISIAVVFACPKEYGPWSVPIGGLVFLVLELLGLILGMIGKSSVTGKVGLALSGSLLGILIVISALVMIF
jgi:hypothetical protein